MIKPRESTDRGSHRSRNLAALGVALLVPLGVAFAQDDTGDANEESSVASSRDVRGNADAGPVASRGFDFSSDATLEERRLFFTDQLRAAAIVRANQKVESGEISQMEADRLIAQADAAIAASLESIESDSESP